MSLRIVEIDGVGLVDGAGGVTRLAVDVNHNPEPPAGATPVQFVADTPLAVAVAETAEYTIPNGKRFYLQQLQAGAEGDTTEKGNRVEVIYYDGAAEHVVARQYIMGQTQWINFPDVGAARDGTPIDGDGSTKKLRIVRERLGGSTQEVDAVVFGYERDTP